MRADHSYCFRSERNNHDFAQFQPELTFPCLTESDRDICNVIFSTGERTTYGMLDKAQQLAAVAYTF
ncbi:MAG: hypothetical protein CMN84_12340 [Spongiibacteraceae bacterium]|nr:hypothetical protein [Spongiibacteraceae bacterium]